MYRERERGGESLRERERERERERAGREGVILEMLKLYEPVTLN